jgi:hypothetical protein
MLRVICALVVALGVARARANTLSEPDVEIGRRHYEKGAKRYAQADYAGALEAFQLARRVYSAPELDFNIARCHDRLEHPREAIASYQRYLDARPATPETPEIQERIRVLRERLGDAQPAPATERPSPRRWVAPGAVLGGAVAVAAIGAGLTGSVNGPLADVRTTWGDHGEGATAALRDERDSLERRAYAGYALLGVAGAVAIADLALWIVAARRGHR